MVKIEEIEKMTNKNCLNCVFLDKVNKCCSIEKDYELIATWCDCYKKRT